MRSEQGATQDILSALSQSTESQFETAQSLPPAIYHDAGIYDLEIENIFRKEWICVGLLADIPNSGDYFCRDVVDAPIIVIRQRDGSVMAFANVCLHRAARLLDGAGSIGRISCPYHSWTYDVDGQLIGAPMMQDTQGFDQKSCRLKTLACDTWEGFVYINLDTRADPISKRLTGLSALVGDFKMADYVPVYAVDEVWDTNWKCLVENYMDAYHIHRVHRESFGKYSSSTAQTKLFDGDSAYSYHYVQEDDEPRSVHAHPENTWLTGDQRNRTYLINVFPSHTMQLQPDMLWYLSILPLGTKQLKVHWAVSIPAEILDSTDNRQAHIDELLALIHQVNGEDQPIVESIGNTTRSPHAVRGPLSYLERNVWQFGRYLQRMLVKPYPD